MDAYTTVATLQRYTNLLAALERTHTDKPQQVHTKLCRQMESLRNNVPYDADAAITDAIQDSQEHQFGKPVPDTSDAGLISLGFVKGT